LVRIAPLRRPALVVMIGVEWTIAFGAVPLVIAGGIAIPFPVMALGHGVLDSGDSVFVPRIQAARLLQPTTPYCSCKGVTAVASPSNLDSRWSRLICGGLLMVLSFGPFVLRS